MNTDNNSRRLVNKRGDKISKDGIQMCSLVWRSHLSQREFFSLQGWQKVNHFPDSWAIGRKDRLTKCLERAKRHNNKRIKSFINDKKASNGSGNGVYGYYPKTWIFPRDYESWKKTAKKDSIFILKPKASRCGRGIRLHKGTKSVPKLKNCICQDYIKNPYLINERKFDLRLYVLVSTFNPLRIFLFREGITRFATIKYSISANAEKFAYLTNYSINKMNENYIEQEGDELESSTCGKWSLVKLWNELAKKEGKDVVEECQAKIKDVIVKTIIAADAEITPALGRSTRAPKACFELFGFDILLDKRLQPWLLEVNILDVFLYHIGKLLIIKRKPPQESFILGENAVARSC